MVRGPCLPPAGLELERFQFASDLFSYAMTCIEIYQDGVVPWSHIFANQEVMDLVKAGKRHPKLRVLSPETYAKLNECWATDPKARPSFEDMRDYFKADLVRLTMASPQASSVITALDTGSVLASEAVVDQQKVEKDLYQDTKSAASNVTNEPVAVGKRTKAQAGAGKKEDKRRAALLKAQQKESAKEKKQLDKQMSGLVATDPAAKEKGSGSSWWGCCGGGSKSGNAGGETEFGVPEPNKDENGFVDDGRGVFTFEMPD